MGPRRSSGSSPEHRGAKAGFTIDPPTGDLIIARVAKRILVVEDTRSIREIIAHLLRGRGYEVEVCGDGAEAPARLASFAPDLVILDAMLPGKSGFDLCAELKAAEGTRGIRVLMLTAATRDSGRGEEYWKERSRADDFMTKPFKGVELVERVARLLGEGT